MTLVELRVSEEQLGGNIISHPTYTLPAFKAGLHGNTIFQVASEFASFNVMAIPVQYASRLNLRILTLPNLEASSNKIN